MASCFNLISLNAHLFSSHSAQLAGESVPNAGSTDLIFKELVSSAAQVLKVWTPDIVCVEGRKGAH